MRKLLTCVLIGLHLLCLSLPASNILFFNQDCNFDLSGEDNSCFDERHNLLNLLNEEGHTITLLESWNHPNLATFLAANDFLLIPDMEDAFVNCRISDSSFLNVSTKSSLQNYTLLGGSIILVGSSQNVDFLNTVFDLDIVSTTVAVSGYAVKNNEGAIGTPFQNCPDSLANLNATFLLTSSIPESKRCIYSSGSMASVALFSVGVGSILYLAYDYNDAGPGCTHQGFSWGGCVLSSAIRVAQFGPSGRPVVSSIPVMSLNGFILIGLVILVTGLTQIKSIQ